MNLNRIFSKSALSALVLAASATAAMAAPAVVTGRTSVKAEPTKRSHTVDRVYRGERVDVLGCRHGWCYITHPGPDGWMRGNVLARLGRPLQPEVRFFFNFGVVPNFGGGYDHHHDGGGNHTGGGGNHTGGGGTPGGGGGTPGGGGGNPGGGGGTPGGGGGNPGGGGGNPGGGMHGGGDMHGGGAMHGGGDMHGGGAMHGGGDMHGGGKPPCIPGVGVYCKP